MLEVPGRAAGAASFSKIDFSGCRTVIAAVSGGGDSLALLFLLKEHLARHAPGVEPVAVTVDHGMRPEAAAEARAVAALCEEIGVSHRTMRWEEAKPATGLQQAAREARYALLAEAAKEAEAGLIITGHTLDDQLETFAMRKRRGDGRGLAGIAPATLYDGSLWIARPLLEVRREDLRSYLRARGVAWHEDPSNRDPKYERARVRSLLADRSGPDIHEESIDEIGHAAAERVRQGTSAAALIRRHAQVVSPGLYRLDREFTFCEERDAAIYALRILLAVIGGRSQLPDQPRAAALLEHLSAPDARATLSRSVVEARQDGFYMHRELRGLPHAAAPGPGEIWDGRYRIGAGVAQGVEIAPFGKEAAEAWGAPDERGRPALSRAALAAEPALLRGAECLGHAPATPVAGPWARFLPSFDLAAAVAVAELVGGTPLPPAPLASHPTQ
ncbi:MAG: tRNA lysidine(34) synthetase TilS [Hyphomicrobiales bacterium]|nr:tRNA lysidine(34) synthetase TilS [Hyphomicrobiales bacterium]